MLDDSIPSPKIDIPVSLNRFLETQPGAREKLTLFIETILRIHPDFARPLLSEMQTILPEFHNLPLQRVVEAYFASLLSTYIHRPDANWDTIAYLSFALAAFKRQLLPEEEKELLYIKNTDAFISNVNEEPRRVQSRSLEEVCVGAGISQKGILALIRYLEKTEYGYQKVNMQHIVEALRSWSVTNLMALHQFGSHSLDTIYKLVNHLRGKGLIAFQQRFPFEIELENGDKET